MDCTTQATGCALPETDRDRLQRHGHSGIAELLDGLERAAAAGPEGRDWVDVAYGAGTLRVSVAPAAAAT